MAFPGFVQLVVHEPQCVGSVIRSAQAPSMQAVSGQLEQVPPTQNSSAAQVLPQVPQLSRSVLRFTQAPLQTWGAPAGQLHIPPEQLPPTAQTVGHVPQCASSVCRSVHSDPQMSGVAPPQVSVQTPATQDSPGSQATPQPAPVVQWLRSVRVSVQAPSQAVCPGGQVHVPITQLAPRSHSFPQDPQLSRSVW